LSFPSHYAIPPTATGTRRDGDRTRAKALQVAAAQISAIGFNKMTIARVAADAGVSQSGLLHHFPSKAALLAAVLDEREREDSEFLFGDGSPPLGWDAFESLVALSARNQTRPEWVELFVRTSAEATVPGHPAHDWVTRHYQSLRKLAHRRCRARNGTGRDPAGRAGAVHGRVDRRLLDGMQQQWGLEPREISMVDNVREHVRLLRMTWS
jgi:AcrR family transcriptional regulator